MYDELVSTNHLEIGCGTGFFLDHCAKPIAHLVLLDLSANSLNHTTARLQRFHPSRLETDILKPNPIPQSFGPFQSIGMNYVLHCLPGTFAAKAAALQHARALLAPGGVFFGATVLGQGVHHNRLGRLLMWIYNRVGTFGNAADTQADLEQILDGLFSDVTVTRHGRVAIFVARA